MSLIHEALKKAEQQRRLGEPPNLGTPFAATRQRRTLLPYLAIAIAAALGAGWWLSRDSAPEAPSQAAAPAAARPTAANKAAGTPPPAAPAAGTDATAAVNGQAASSAAGRRPVMGANATANSNVVPSLAPPPQLNHQAPAQNNPPTVKEVAERESEPHPPGANPLAPGEAAPLTLGTPPPETPLNDPAGVAAKMAVKERQLAATPAAAPAAGQPATRQPPSFPSAAAPEGEPATPPVAAVAKSAPPSLPPPSAKPIAAAQKPQPAAVAPPTPPPQPVAAATQKPQPAAVPPPPTPPPPQPVAAAAPPLEQLPAYWQLPYNVRKELPALKLSMHVYSATPAQRFVVLNGNRQVEGDELGGEVRVTEIRSDGVVLSFQGQRFLVPRGGS